MNSKSVIIIVCIAACATLSACSLRPQKKSGKIVEQIAQECINYGITYTGERPVTEDSGAGAYVWYNFIDNRGIEFRVGIDNRYVMFVEPVRPFYSGSYAYVTDYKSKVMEYYSEEIAEILEAAGAKEYKTTGSLNGGINVEFKEGTSITDIAEAVAKIDELLAYDYRYNDNASGKIESDPDAYWSAFVSYDILVRMSEEIEGKTQDVVYDSFKFSDNRSTILTYDKILQTIEADMYSRKNGGSYMDPVGMLMDNGTLYIDSGDILTDYDEDDYDDTTSLRVPQIPQNDGESNKGAGIKYKYTSDGLIVYHSDGAHIYRPK